MQPFCNATTLLSVRVRRWLLRMREASTLTLGFDVSYIRLFGLDRFVSIV
jgi:hypothetical protein